MGTTAPPPSPVPPGIALTSSERDGTRRLSLRGQLDVAAAGGLWTEALHAASMQPARRLVIDLAGLEGCDTAGAALLLAMAETRPAATLEGARPRVAAVLARARAALVEPPRLAPAQPASWRVVIGHGVAAADDGLVFLGEALLAMLLLPARSRQFRYADLLRTADQAGVRAVPLVLLVGLLIGLILAFQSLVPMRRFGADVYVANLVAVSLLRELGPLLVAVVLAGRSGSAFAAEIGTMKVNQEVDALVTMGIDPMTLLVLPRMAAAILVMPALTVLLEVAGLVGMSVVLVAGGIPLVAIGNQVTTWVRPQDFYGGLAKAMVFGVAVTAVACRAGLTAGNGPRAVGQAATEAVVGGIVATVLLDGLFAVLFYRLGL